MSGRPTAINGHSWPGRGDPAQYASPGRLRPAERLHEHAGLVFVAAAERGRTPERWGLGVALSIVGRSLIAGELVVADDLVDRDRATRNRLDAWASSQLLDTPVGKHPLGLVTRRQYLDPDKGGFLRAYTGRGFLLTADEGRSLGLLADHWAPAAGKRWAGAFTLGLASWGEIGEWTSNGRAHRGWRPLLHRPELRVKALGEHGLLAEFRPAGKSGYGPPAADGKQPRVGSWERADGHWRPFRGRIVDLIGPAFALDGIDTSDLSEHLDAYGLPALDVPPAVRINEDEAAQLLDVARAIHGLAVAVDAEAALWLTPAEDRREGRARVGLRFLVSPGSLHAKMREASGATPPLARQVPDDESLDRYTAGAHGGLVGCVVPGEILPGNDVDVHGSYPAAWSLLGCDRFFSAAELIEEDCAEDLHQLAEQVAAGAVEPLFDPATYRHLGLARADVEVSDGQVFPVEVAGDPGEPGRFAMRRIGALLQLSCSWPDVLASSIASGQALRVPWAKRLVSHGSGEPRPVPLRDGVVVLPGEDPVVVAVRLRDAAKATGNQRLAGQLRLFANASWGNSARLDLTSHRDPRTHRSMLVETPARWTWPPIAATVPAVVRLWLVLLQHLVAAAGSTFLTFDTDGAVIVASPEGGEARLSDGRVVRVLSWAEVDAILRPFDRLDPFGDGDSFWTVSRSVPS